MNKGLMSLRGYQSGGGVGDDWIERLVRQLQKRWMNTKGKLYPHLTEMSDWERGELDPTKIWELDKSAFDVWNTDDPHWWGNWGEASDAQNPIVDELIDLSNFELTRDPATFDVESMKRLPDPQASPSGIGRDGNMAPPPRHLSGKSFFDPEIGGVRPGDDMFDQLWQRHLKNLTPEELLELGITMEDLGIDQPEGHWWPELAGGDLPLGSSEDEVIEELIRLSNPSAFDRPPMPLPPGPRAVPPRSGGPTLSEDLRGMGIGDDDLYEEAFEEFEKTHGPIDINTPAMSQADMQAAMISIREQEILDAALSGDINERRKLKELDKLMKLKEEIDYDANWPDIGSEGWQSIDEHGRPYNEFSQQRTGWSGPESWKKWQRRSLDFIDPINPDFAKALRGVPWGSTVAPFLGAAAAAAVNPLALAAEQAIDFAITPTDIPRRGSQPRHTFMSQQEMDWEDVLSGDLDLQSYVDIHGTGPDIWDNPLGISPGAQTAKDKFLRQMRAGTSVNRYR